MPDRLHPVIGDVAGACSLWLSIRHRLACLAEKLVDLTVVEFHVAHHIAEQRCLRHGALVAVREERNGGVSERAEDLRFCGYRVDRDRCSADLSPEIGSLRAIARRLTWQEEKAVCLSRPIYARSRATWRPSGFAVRRLADPLVGDPPRLGDELV